jgi:hypothetical protein
MLHQCGLESGFRPFVFLSPAEGAISSGRQALTSPADKILDRRRPSFKPCGEEIPDLVSAVYFQAATKNNLTCGLSKYIGHKKSPSGHFDL